MKKKHKAEPKGRMGRRRFLPTIFCLLISLSLLPACYEPQSGCLDNEALNYDLDADNPCSDCCEYPSLVLDVQHRFITDSTTAGIIPGSSVHLDDFGNPFRIKQFRCFISNIHLQDAGAMPLEVEEKLGLVVIEGPRIRLDTVEDNFALVDAAQLPDDLAVRELSPAEDSLEITWHPDGRRSRYAAAWLRANCFADAERKRRRRSTYRVWDTATLRRPSTIPHADFQEDAGLAECLEALHRYGVCLLRDVPTTPGQVVFGLVCVLGPGVVGGAAACDGGHP